MGKNCEVREIIGLMFVGNEDDILEPCIRHNIRYLDRLTVVLDSKSVDDSLRIVTNLIAEGLPIDLISQAVHLNLDFRNDFVKKNNAWAYVFIDDDEFIFGVQPELLRKYIFECESSKYIALPWKTFIINPNDYDCSDIPRSLKYARKFEDPQYFKVIYIKGESEITHKIGAGAHIVDGLTGISFRDLFLAHYPVRSAKQITLKYFASSLDYRLLLRDKLPEGHGWHLRSGFEKMINEGMNITVNMSTNENGEPHKSVTVNADGDDAEKLADILKLAGLHGESGDECGVCGASPCGCAEVVDENQPNWPTNSETSDNALQYSGGINGPKSTGQTTGAPINDQPSRQGAMESKDLGMRLYKELQKYKN